MFIELSTERYTELLTELYIESHNELSTELSTELLTEPLTEHHIKPLTLSLTELPNIIFVFINLFSISLKY